MSADTYEVADRHDGTAHHKIHGWTGWGIIIGLPFVIWGAVAAIGGGSAGFAAWLSSPLRALGFLLFATAAFWYVKLEMDEVIVDYFPASRQKLILLNTLAALTLWAVSAVAVGLLAFG